jgi:hypothetical protein
MREYQKSNIEQGIMNVEGKQDIAGQVSRRGTSPAPNPSGEVQSAEHRPDFINKMKVCREAKESGNFIIRNFLFDIRHSLYGSLYGLSHSRKRVIRAWRK